MADAFGGGQACTLAGKVPTTMAGRLGLQPQQSPGPFHWGSWGNTLPGREKAFTPSATVPDDAPGRPTHVGIHVTLSGHPA